MAAFSAYQFYGNYVVVRGSVCYYLREGECVYLSRNRSVNLLLNELSLNAKYTRTIGCYIKFSVISFVQYSWELNTLSQQITKNRFNSINCEWGFPHTRKSMNLCKKVNICHLKFSPKGSQILTNTNTFEIYIERIVSRLFRYIENVQPEINFDISKARWAKCGVELALSYDMRKAYRLVKLAARERSD